MRRALFTLAWLNVVLHVAGLLFAAFGMRPNIEGEQLDEYIRGAPLGWTLGWMTWMLCAIALIAFLATAVNRLPPPASMARLGLTFAVVGLGFDLLCDSVYIFVLPSLGKRWSPNLFEAVLRITDIASLFIANGGYSVGILLINSDMSRDERIMWSTTFVGRFVGIGGVLLAVTAFTNVPLLIAFAAGPTMLLFCVWVVLVARDLEKPA